MVNVYFFYKEAVDPVGFTEIAEQYRGRLIKLGGTPLNTGGEDEHDHGGTGTVDNIAPKAVDGVAFYGTGGNLRQATPTQHIHPSGQVNEVGAASNFPLHRTIRVFCRDVSGWDGKLPQHSIVMRSSVPIGWSEVSFTEFLRTSATANQTAQGRNQHHVTGSLAPAPSHESSYNNSSQPHAAADQHPHNFEGDVDGGDYDYYYAAIQFIEALADAYVRKDSILLFDGDPGSSWELVSTYDGRYLKFGDGDWQIGGSYDKLVHTQQETMNSQGSGGEVLCGTGSGSPYYLPEHVHSLRVNLPQDTAEPSYVNLLPYKAKRSFGRRASVIIAC